MRGCRSHVLREDPLELKMPDEKNMPFRRPLALDPAGVLTRPDHANREIAYVCPACAAPVVYRHGPKVSAHFAHTAASNCNLETVVHKSAKRLIEQAVRDWLAGQAPSPTLVLQCSICDHPNRQDLPAAVTDVRLEHRLSSGHVADVALLSGDEIALVVEIRVSHAVDDDKARDLVVPFVELDGYELTGTQSARTPQRTTMPRPASTLTAWSPIRDNLSHRHCHFCQDRLVRFQNKLSGVAAACGLEIPPDYFRPGICCCWKCRKEIVVFAWPKSDDYEENAPMSEPKPLTIQYRATTASGTSYWLPVCPYCGEAQGNHFLYNEPDGPFFKMNEYQIVEGLEPNFQRDLYMIAFMAEYNGII